MYITLLVNEPIQKTKLRWVENMRREGAGSTPANCFQLVNFYCKEYWKKKYRVCHHCLAFHITNKLRRKFSCFIRVLLFRTGGLSLASYRLLFLLPSHILLIWSLNVVLLVSWYNSRMIFCVACHKSLFVNLVFLKLFPYFLQCQSAVLVFPL